MRSNPGRFYEFGEFRLDADERTLRRNGEIVRLQPKLFDLLLTMVENSNRLLEKEELMKRVWPDTFVEEINLARNISDLRKLLGDTRSDPLFIETIPKRGYRFVAEVRLSHDDLPVEKNNVIPFVSHSTATDSDGINEMPSVETSGNLLLAPAKDSFATASASPLRELSPIERTGKRAWLVAAFVLLAGSLATAYWFIEGRRAREPFREIDIARLTEAGKVVRAVISPDGKHVAYVQQEPQSQSLWIRQVATPSAVRILNAQGSECWGLTFSPDSNYIYYVLFDGRKSDPMLCRIPALGGLPEQLPVVTLSPVSFSPDGKRMAYMVPSTSAGGSLLCTANVDGTDNKILALAKDPDFLIMEGVSPAWSPDGKTILCSLARTGPDGLGCEIAAVRVEDGEMTFLTSGKWAYIGQIAWLSEDEVIFIGVEPDSSLDQIWHLSMESNRLRRITNDLAENQGISLTSDKKALVTVQSNSASSFWVVTDGDFANAVRLPLDTGRVEGMALAPDGRIFYRSSAAGRQTIFVVGQDARANRLPFDSPGDAEIAVSPDGRYMVFSSNREGKLNLWRADADGGNLLRLTDGEGELRPCFTPDGRWIVYQKGFGNVATSFWKVSVDGGPSEQVSDLRIKTPSVSPDGRMIAGFFMDSSEQERPWRIGVISLESGLMLRKFDVPSTIFSHRIRWTPDGKALAYIHGGGDVSNIMVQPLDGSPPKQFTDFKADQVIDFAWAQDSRRFVCARAAESSYVALILGR